MALRLLAPLPRALPQVAPFGFLSAVTWPSISITFPSSVADVWESVLRAVPKKKTSHMKKRHRQMAGKALKDVQSLNKCPGCGQIKRAHLLCPPLRTRYQGLVENNGDRLNAGYGLDRLRNSTVDPSVYKI